MDYRVMMGAEKAIGVLPFSRRLYQISQRLVGHGERINLHNLITNRGFDTVEILTETTDFSFRDARIIEIGTGWHAADPFLFYLLGAAEIHTYDHIRWLELDTLKQTITSLQKAIPELSETFDYNQSDLKERFNRIEQTGEVEDILESAHITYHQTDFEANEMDGEFDLFYSCSTLQRIPERILPSLLDEIATALREGGVSYHTIHPKDYHAQYDNSLNPFQYLSYSDKVWSVLTDEDINNQNRLRHVDFLRIFEQAGFTNRYDRSVIFNPELVEDVSSVKRFHSYRPEELAIGQTQLVSTLEDSSDGSPLHQELLRNEEVENVRGDWGDSS